jgi:hypothetical protein
MIYFNIVIPTYYYDTGVKNILKSIPKSQRNIFINIYDNTQNNRIYNIYLKYKNSYVNCNINYIRNRPVKAAAINWNLGLSEQDKLIKKKFNSYIILLHQDEFFCKNFFITLSSIIKKNNYPDVVSCSTILIKKKKILNKIHTTAKQRKFFFNFNFYYILKRNFIGPTSSMIIKFKSNILFFNTSLYWLVDVEYYIKIFLNSKKWIFTDEIFVYSDQLNKHSLTYNLKKKISLLNRLETKLIKKKFNLNNKFYFPKIFDIFIWASIRIYNKIKIFFIYKKFFR